MLAFSPRTLIRHAVLLGVVAGAAAAHGAGVSCLVLGDKATRVLTPDGERTPVFMATDCAALRVTTGTAQASWVGRDGRPHLQPIGPEGPSLVPPAGAEERTVRTLWSELTSRRDRKQGAFMRDVGEPRPTRIYLPVDGLPLAEPSDGPQQLQIVQVTPTGSQPFPARTIPAGAAVRLERALMVDDAVYHVTVERDGVVKAWRLRTVPASDVAIVEKGLAEVHASVAAGEQQLMVEAMLFDQMRLGINAEQAMDRLHKLREN